MREIKFRVWDGIEMFFFVLDNQFDCHCGWLKNSILMQFTGLKDKNGKGVYEGDKILYLGAKGEVYYCNNTCMFMVGFGVNRSTWSFDSMDSLIEVIGNIYENNAIKI